MTIIINGRECHNKITQQEEPPPIRNYKNMENNNKAEKLVLSSPTEVIDSLQHMTKRPTIYGRFTLGQTLRDERFTS